MSGTVTADPMALADTRTPDRVVTVGLVGLRALRYVAKEIPPALPPIEGLRVEAVGHKERPGWHPATGLYGFLALPPGQVRILVTDPHGRWLPAAFNAAVPNRTAVKQALERGIAAPAMDPRPLLRDIALHAAPGRAVALGTAAVFGVVKEGPNGPPVPFARLALNTLVKGTLRAHVTWSSARGEYVLPSPGENPAAIGGNPPWKVERNLVVHAPNPAFAAALARDFLAALPADQDSLDPDAADAPFLPRAFALRDGQGMLRSPVNGVNPKMEVLAGQQQRWDIELF